MTDTSDYEHCVFCSLESSNDAHDVSTKLDELNEKVTSHFKKVCPLSSFYLYEQSRGHYMASALFKKDKDLKSSEKTGLRQKLADYVYAELESAGLGRRDQISIQFNFESSESMDFVGKTTNIPTDEEFARADRLDQERSRNLDNVCEAVKQHFMGVCPLHNVYILWQQDVDFRAYVFFEKDKDIKACKDSGVIRDMIDFVYDELERAGRGKRGAITVGFEFDSDENVVANYEGDYLLRLR
jgi:hypothetical protein